MKRWILVVMLAVLPIAIDAQSAATPPSQAPAAATPAAAPAAPLPDMSWKARFLSQYQYIRRNLAQMAEKMPAELYGYQPTPEIKTFAANMGHIIRSNAAQCSTLIGRRLPLADQDLEKTVTAKADLVKAINEMFTFCDEYFTTVTDDQLKTNTFQSYVVRDGQKIPIQVPHVSSVASLLAHSNEMYGYMSVYMRLKGLVPPSSERADGK